MVLESPLQQIRPPRRTSQSTGSATIGVRTGTPDLQPPSLLDTAGRFVLPLRMFAATQAAIAFSSLMPVSKVPSAGRRPEPTQCDRLSRLPAPVEGVKVMDRTLVATSDSSWAGEAVCSRSKRSARPALKGVRTYEIPPGFPRGTSAKAPYARLRSSRGHLANLRPAVCPPRITAAQTGLPGHLHPLHSIFDAHVAIEPDGPDIGVISPHALSWLDMDSGRDDEPGQIRLRGVLRST